MRHSLARSVAFLGFLAQGSTAASCTSSNATPVEQYISSGGGGAGGVAPGVFTEVYNVLSYAVKRSETPNARLANVAYVLHPRANTVQCTGAEMCFSIQSVPFCLDITSGFFHDGDGTSGNALSGDYTLSDGRKGNMYNGPHPLPSGQEVTIASTTAAGSGATSAPNAGAGAGSTPTGASPAATNGAATHGKIGAVLGGALMVGAGLL